MREDSTVGVKIAVLLSFNSSLNFVETFNIPVPHMIEKVIEVVKFIPQEQVQSRIMEQIIDTPVSQIQETDEVPWTQFIYKAVDVPVIVRRQVPIIRKVQKTAQGSQAQLIDKVMEVPVHMQRQVPDELLKRERTCGHGKASSVISSCAENRGDLTGSVH